MWEGLCNACIQRDGAKAQKKDRNESKLKQYMYLKAVEGWQWLETTAAAAASSLLISTKSPEP